VHASIVAHVAEISDPNTQWKMIDGETGEENINVMYEFKKDDVVKIHLINDEDSDHPGTCPKCGGMKLVPQKAETQPEAGEEKQEFARYMPLFVIVSLIAFAALLGAWNGSSIDSLKAIQIFMAGFFFVFSGFKLLDIRDFAEGYSQYDLLAKRWHGYGYLYPFLELGMGMAFILIPTSPVLHLVTIGIMGFSGIGVGIKIAKRRKFQCACLGTFVKVPLTSLTLAEDFGMVLMAAAMLLLF
jgi:hypothetical protein